jgi:iron complex outermembrane receptor protein
MKTQANSFGYASNGAARAIFGAGTALTGSLLVMTGPLPAMAQTALPEIVVSSPIVRRAPQRSEAPRPAPRLRRVTVRPAAPPEPAPPPPQVPFSPVSVVTAAQIQETPGSTLGDTVFALPGVTGNSFAPGASRPVIRGLDNARVRVQENGIGAMDVSTISEDHAVPIDPLTTEKLEIIRGPATLRWGPQAIGGVVAASNNRIPDPMTPAGYSLVTKSAVSSVDRGIEGGVILDARNNDYAFHADYYRRKAGDYSIPGGRQANTAVDQEGMAVGASRFFENGYVGVSISHYSSLYGIPGTEAAEGRTRIDLQQTKVQSKGEFRTGGSIVDTVRFWLGGTDYKHDERAIDSGADRVMATFKNREVEGRAEFQFVPVVTSLGELNTALGVQGGHAALGTSGEAGSLLAPADTTRLAAYVFNELTVTPAFRLQGAGRVGYNRVAGTAASFPADLLPNGGLVPEAQRERNFAPASVSFAALYDLSYGVVARGSISYSQRAPEAQELFSKGPHEASGTFEIGSAALGKEAATSFEVGLAKKTGSLRFDASLFHTRYQGFIFKRLTGNTCGEEFDACVPGSGEELRQVAFDQRNANFTGAELSAQLDVMPIGRGMFGIEGQYDFVRARFDDGSNVPRMPPHRVGGGVFWRDGQWATRVFLLHAFAQNDVGADEFTTTPGYNLLSASISYTHRFAPHEFVREMTVGLIGTNLLDDDVRNSVSFKKDEVLLQGRGVRAFATLRF